jgi:hypothetical protein
MKYSCINFFILLLYCTCFSCGKDSNNDSPYFIEAAINGVKWRGTSNGKEYIATSNDGSKMKISVSTPMGPQITDFNFFTNAGRTGIMDNNPDFMMQWVIGAYDSKIKIKWETTFENNIDRFEIEQGIADGLMNITWQKLGSVPGSGNSNTLKQYSFTAPDVSVDVLNSLFYRIKVFTTSGTYRYTVVRSAGLLYTPALISYYTKDHKLYFALDDNNNQMSLTSFSAPQQERQGTFSFNYKDETGNIIQVRNGKFHLKLE